MPTFENVYLPKNVYKTVRTVIDPTTQGEGRIANSIPPNLGLNLAQFVQDAIDNEFITITPDPADVEQTTASNGLYLSTYDVRLGGALTENTTVDMTGFTMNFDGNSITLGDYGVGTHDPGSTPPYFLAVSATGVVKERTPAQVLTDIGGPFTSENIYNTSDSLTGNRVVTQGAFSLEFNTGTSTFTAGASPIRLNIQPTANLFRIGDYTGAGNSTGITGNDSTRQIKIGDITGAENDTYIQVDDSGSIVNINNELRLPQYGVGTYSGTAAYALFVDATGNVIEEAVPAGPSPFYNIYTASDNIIDDRTVGLDGYYLGVGYDSTDAEDDLIFLIDPVEQRIRLGNGTSPNVKEIYLSAEEIAGDGRIYIGMSGGDGIQITTGGNADILVDADGSVEVEADESVFLHTNDVQVVLDQASLTVTTTEEFRLSDYGTGTYNDPSAYLLGVTATGYVVEVNASAYAQNLWATFTGDAGSTTANTTTDTFNIVGGTGISTAIVGDTITITNTGVGATYTASNGLLLDTADFQMGNTATGTGAADLTRNTWIHLDTFDLNYETATGDVMKLDAGTNWVIIGDNSGTPQVPLHVIKGGTSGDVLGNANALLMLQDTTNGAANAYMQFASGNTGSSLIYFGDTDSLSVGSIGYVHNGDYLQFRVNSTEFARIETDGQVTFHAYGIGDFYDTPVYMLGVLADGRVIEVDPGGAGALLDADNGLIVYNSDTVRLGSESAGSGTHDFTANRYIYLDTFDLYFASSTEANLLFLDGGASRVGIGTATPAGFLHVQLNATGGTADTAADDLIIENTTNAGISILTSNSGDANIYLGDVADPTSGIINFDSTSGTLNIGTNRTSGTTQLIAGTGLNSLLIKATGALKAQQYGVGTFPGTATYYLGVDADGDIIEVSPPGVGAGPNLWLTFNADSGTTSANTTTDTLTVTGGTGITTSISGDTLTITNDVTDTSIYVIDGSLTGNRTLTGTTYTLDYNFTSGSNVSTYRWDDAGQYRDVNNATNTYNEDVTANAYAMTHTAISSGNTTFFSHTPSLIQLGKTNASLYDHSFAMTAGTLVASVTSNVTGHVASFTLDSSTNNTLLVENTTHDASIGLVRVSNDVEVRIRTKTVDLATASAGQVLTLVDASDGYCEWAPAPSAGSQNLWLTIQGDSGSTSANTTTDTLQVIGGTGITTSIAGDILTITSDVVDTSVYVIDGSLTGTRTVDLNGYNLYFTDTGGSSTITSTWFHNNFHTGIYFPGSGITYGHEVVSGEYRAGSYSGVSWADPYRKMVATATSIGLYSDDSTNTAHVEIDYTNDTVELLSDIGSNESYIIVDGASNTINSTNGGGSYSRILTNGATDTVTITVYDGGSDTNSLTVDDVRTKASSSWVDSGVINDATSRSSDNHNYAPTDLNKKRIIRYNSTGFHYLTGIAGASPEDGMVIEIWNVGTAAFNVRHDNASSTAANRIYCPGSGDFRISENGAAVFRYDAISSRWRIIAAI